MKQVIQQKSLFERVVISVILILSLILMTNGEFIERIVNSDCTDHCDDSCESCGDCVYCSPSIPMLHVIVNKNHKMNQVPSIQRPRSTNLSEITHLSDIFRPPRFLS